LHYLGLSDVYVVAHQVTGVYVSIQRLFRGRKSSHL
jgi:hypothetical protein